MVKKLWWILFWVGVVAFVLLYPMMMSIYVNLPLLIGFAGYLVIWGIEGHGLRYIWFPLLYLLNLEANLSLPMFLSLLAILLFYLTLYERIRYFKRCPVCVGLLSVMGLNFYYLCILLSYDFLFDTTSIMVNSLLLYSLLFDLVLVVLL